MKFVLCAAAYLAWLEPTAAAAQDARPAAAVQDEWTVLARAHVAISQLREQFQKALAEPANKKAEVQLELREKLLTDVAKILGQHQMTQAEYDRRIHEVSVDTVRRRLFEAAIGEITGRKPET
jgi:hypothetical protein